MILVHDDLIEKPAFYEKYDLINKLKWFFKICTFPFLFAIIFAALQLFANFCRNNFAKAKGVLK